MNEQRHRPLSGRLLCIANLTVNLTPEETLEFGNRYGLTIDAERLVLDDITRAGDGNRVDMRSFFRAISGCEVDVLDISAYEGATVIADLNEDVPAELFGRYDVIVEGGTLDNIFDPANALRNLHRMLSNGGRLFSTNVFNASLFNSAYVSLPPDWFFDFFAWNQYHALCLYFVHRGPAIAPEAKQWILETKLVDRHVDLAQIFQFIDDPKVPVEIRRQGPEWQFWATGKHLGSLFRCDVTAGRIPIGDVILVAEKGEVGHYVTNPVQIHYRSPKDNLEMFRRALRFTTDERPPLIEKISREDALPYIVPMGPI